MQYDNDFGVTPEALGAAEPEATCKHGLDPEVCKKCLDAKRKREDRKRDKIEKEADKSQTLEQFWKAQRSLVSPSTLAPLLERQERVKDNIFWLQCWLNDSYNDPNSPHFCDPSDTDCYVGFAEGAADVIQDYETFGFCQTEISWNEFWKDPDLFQMLTSRNDATATFARYGLVVAVPEHHYNAFQRLLKQKYLKDRFGMSVPEYVYVGADVLAPNYDGKGYPTENYYRARQEKSK